MPKKPNVTSRSPLQFQHRNRVTNRSAVQRSVMLNPSSSNCNLRKHMAAEQLQLCCFHFQYLALCILPMALAPQSYVSKCSFDFLFRDIALCPVHFVAQWYLGHSKNRSVKVTAISELHESHDSNSKSKPFKLINSGLSSC